MRRRVAIAPARLSRHRKDVAKVNLVAPLRVSIASGQSLQISRLLDSSDALAIAIAHKCSRSAQSELGTHRRESSCSALPSTGPDVDCHV